MIRRLLTALRARREAQAFPADTGEGFPGVGMQAPARWRTGRSCRNLLAAHGYLCCRPAGHRSPWHAATDLDGTVIAVWLGGAFPPPPPPPLPHFDTENRSGVWR